MELMLCGGVTCLIDDEDWDRIKAYKWCRHAKKKYAGARVEDRMVLMHRMIMNAPKGVAVDHINHDTFDNRKMNLRICTQAENMWNAKHRGSNTKIRGIHFRKKVGNYQVDITSNGKRLYLGVYSNLEDAITVRKEAEIKYHGEYRYQAPAPIAELN